MYIFNSSSLSVLHLQIFSPSLWFVFSSLDTVFCRTDIFKFDKVQLIIYSCIMPLVLYLKSYHHHHHTQGNLSFLLLSYRIFIFLCFTVRSMIHFDLIFAKDINISRFFFVFFAYGCPVVPDHLLKRVYLLHWVAFASLWNVSCYLYVGPFLDSLFSCINLFVYSFINATIFLITIAV